MDYEAAIQRASRSDLPLLQLSTELFLLGPTKGFEGWEEESFSLIRSVSNFFGVSVRSVHVCGSAKLGFSPIKQTEFSQGLSDLDLAIIDPQCYQRYLEVVLKATRNLRDRTGFPQYVAGYRGYSSFQYYAAKGMLRPDLMPYVPERAAWERFFHGLTLTHRGRFKKITAALYLSDVIFALKQADGLQSYIEAKGYL